MRGDPSALT